MSFDAKLKVSASLHFTPEIDEANDVIVAALHCPPSLKRWKDRHKKH